MTEEMWAEMEKGSQEMCWVRSQACSGNSDAEERTGEKWIWPGPRGSRFSVVFFTNLSPPSLGEILNFGIGNAYTCLIKKGTKGCRQ